jgi:hypothetical protein
MERFYSGVFVNTFKVLKAVIPKILMIKIAEKPYDTISL